MHLPTRRAIFGLLASSLFAVSIPALADGFDGDKLVRFGDPQGVTYDDWVSTDPVSTVTVKKIEGGRLSYVTITKTATGTYSDDGIASRNVQYPGVNERHNALNQFSFSSWNNGHWNRMRTYNGNSYVSVTTYKTHRGQTRTSTCISTASFYYC